MGERYGRTPVVAGRFYPHDTDSLRTAVRGWLAVPPPPEDDNVSGRLWGMMLPHAGYEYCGRVVGATLAGQVLPRHVVILCPNHTGYGHHLGIWPEGVWLTPLGFVPVEETLITPLIQSDGGFAVDKPCHEMEHSIEVLLPFLQELSPDLCITPVCVGTRDPAVLARAGQGLAKALTAWQNAGVETMVIVSSDMNHFEDEATTLEKDNLALAQALACDADGLLRTVSANKITMCGASPLAVALFAAHALGSPSARLMAHDTSATVSGDTSYAVGYAGLRIYLDAGAN
ncbi:MAG: AmmeMemoRadiSam system protein B [Desulfovibrionaceae bacterium]|nr:AmmeMemoRadiSam system protein B [Desulfovibrionaceae bacterium]